MNFKDVKLQHFARDCAALHALSASMAQNPLSSLNVALLDGDKRRAEQVKKELAAQNLSYSLETVSDRIQNHSRLKIVYLLISTTLNGGTKVLIEQANRLSARGHDVLIFSHCPKPSWIDVKASFFLVHPENDLSRIAPRADVVIAGYWSLLPEAMKIEAPLRFHFSQGDVDVFEYDAHDPYHKEAIHTAYSLPVRILTVSDIMQREIRRIFGRSSAKIPDAIDDGFFRPFVPDAANDPPLILLSGSDRYAFKGHDAIFDALRYLHIMGYRFSVCWITQKELDKDYSAYGFPVTQHVMPDNEELVALYRSADIFICGSYYESFGLPAVEAMASGAAVVTAAHGGTLEYARDGVNCLMFRPGNIIELAERVQRLLDDPVLRQNLRVNGYNTARRFTWRRSIHALEKDLNKPVVQAVKV